jgi:hypothetical protein
LETTGPGTSVYKILKKFLFDPKILLGSAFLDYARHTNNSDALGESDGILPEITLEAASGKAAFTVKLQETVLKTKQTLKKVVKDRFVVRAGEAIVDLYLAFGLMIPIPTKLQEEERIIYNLLTTNFDAVPAEEFRRNEASGTNQAVPAEEAGRREAAEARTNEVDPWSNIPAAVLVVV